jgi:hypothetical protein
MPCPTIVLSLEANSYIRKPADFRQIATAIRMNEPPPSLQEVSL